MKKYLFMAVAAIAVLSSCSNDDSFNEDQQLGKAVQFTATLENDASTRTTLDGNDVNWASGDEINVNGSLFSTESTTNSGTFNLVSGQTAVSGSSYIACYPSSMYNGGTISLPASYTYSAGQFNMPMYAQSTTTNLSFKNLCGVLAITVPSTAMTSVSTIVVSSDQQMNGAFTATAGGVLTFAASTPTAAQKKVTLNFNYEAASIESDSKTFYLPVPAGSHTLKVEIFAGTTGKYMTTNSDVSIERNKIYPITFVGKHDSKAIDLGLSVNWATYNVGASKPEEYGDYFAWGATEPWYTSQNPLTWKDGKDDGYTWANAPFNNGSDTYNSDYFTETGRATATGSADGTTLVSTFDAATAKWGTGWRMPTTNEFLELASNCYVKWTNNYKDSVGIIVYKVKNSADKGLLQLLSAWQEISSDGKYKSSSKTKTEATYGETDTHIFLPAAGYSNNTGLFKKSKTTGYYWSSSLVQSTLSNALGPWFESGAFNPQNDGTGRKAGRSVRPVCE